jgi:hypothetical protein
MLYSGKQNMAFLEMPVYPIEDFTLRILYSKEINLYGSRHLRCYTVLTCGDTPQAYQRPFIGPSWAPTQVYLSGPF